MKSKIHAMLSSHAPFYVKLAIACAFIMAINFCLDFYYGRGIPTLVAFPNLSSSPPASDSSYTTLVRKNIHRIKSLQLPVDSTMARPFLRLAGNYRIAPRYNLAFCLIEKAMCTILQNIFCYLYDSDGFVANNHTIAGENSDFWTRERWCFGKNELTGTQTMRLMAPHTSATIYIIRNPIERFISAFANKCIAEKNECFGCWEDVLCVIQVIHTELMNLNRQHWNVSNSMDTVPNRTYVGRHMTPSSWQCDLYDEADNAIFIKYGETPEELTKTYTELAHVFELHGVEKQKIDYIMSSVNGKRTEHATKQLGVRDKYFEKIKASPKHVQLLNEIYFYDYLIFGFDALK